MMTTYRDVKAKIAKLENQARELLKKESAGVIKKIREMMSEYGLSVQDLGLGITRMGERMTALKHPLPPKYQDPVTGKTWSGKGKAPGWIVEAAKQGKKEDYLIAQAVAVPEAKQAVSADKSAPAQKAKPTKKPAPKKAAVAKPAAAKITSAKKAIPASKPAAVAKKAPVAKKDAAVKKAIIAKPAKSVAKTVAKPAVKGHPPVA